MPDERKQPSTEFERFEKLQRRVMPKRDQPYMCTACNAPIGEGQGFTMSVLGPGTDPEARERCQAGKPFAALSTLLHWACATGDATPEGTKCALCQHPLTVEGACGNPECDLFPGPSGGEKGSPA